MEASYLSLLLKAVAWHGSGPRVNVYGRGGAVQFVMTREEASP